MKSFERDLGHYCGLAMVGIKTANIMSCKRKDYEDIDFQIYSLKMRLSNVGITLEVLIEDSEKVMVIVYREKKLQNRLQEESVKDFLGCYGYQSTSDIEAVLDHLRERLQESGGFPHEIGVFLGYPMEDVIGFIQSPSGYKASGVWKVYDNVDEKLKLFDKYKKCVKAINRRMELGHNLTKIFNYAI